MCERSVEGPTTRRVHSSKLSTTNIGIAFLAVASGSLDVIAFLTLGRVFASAMTGNTALLGIAISNGDWVSASRPAIALIGFIIGTATASVASDSNATLARQSATLRGLVLFEACCLVVFAMIRQLSGELMPNMLILLCSFSMGIQGIAAKMVGSPGVNTIVFTSTVVEIASSVTDILLGRQDRPQARSDTIRQVLGFAAYGAGALIAGLLAWTKFFLLAWLPVAAVLLAFACFEAARDRHGIS